MWNVDTGVGKIDPCLRDDEIDFSHREEQFGFEPGRRLDGADHTLVGHVQHTTVRGEIMEHHRVLVVRMHSAFRKHDPVGEVDLHRHLLLTELLEELVLHVERYPSFLGALVVECVFGDTEINLFPRDDGRCPMLVHLLDDAPAGKQDDIRIEAGDFTSEADAAGEVDVDGHSLVVKMLQEEILQLLLRILSHCELLCNGKNMATSESPFTAIYHA